MYAFAGNSQNNKSTGQTQAGHRTERTKVRITICRDTATNFLVGIKGKASFVVQEGRRRESAIEQEPCVPMQIQNKWRFDMTWLLAKQTRRGYLVDVERESPLLHTSRTYNMDSSEAQCGSHWLLSCHLIALQRQCLPVVQKPDVLVNKIRDFT